MQYKFIKTIGIYSSIALLSACTADLNSLLKDRHVSAPQTWSEETGSAPVIDNWLQDINIPLLEPLLQQALTSNIELKQLKYDVEISKQDLASAQSSFFPTLNLSFDQSRSATAKDVNPVNAASLGLTSTYELDVWGKFSDNEKTAQHSLNVAKANYEQARQQLAADVATEWLNIVEAESLLNIYNQRIVNAQNNKLIIETGYDRGLYNAVDVYLIRNTLDTEKSNAASQNAVLKQAKRRLERLLGDYPDASITVALKIPELQSPIKAGLPSEIVYRKASLGASWNQLLSKNAALAYAHKQRLPSLKLTATLSDSATLANGLFSGAPFAWSLLGNITAPIFDGGKLEAAENKAMLELRKAEQQYLSDVYNTYQEVENAMAEETSLKGQYLATLKAQDNAKIAHDLSFEQYQKGLVTYLDVLNSQTLFHDAQSSALKIKSELVKNRIRLHLALGGDFEDKNDQRSQ